MFDCRRGILVKMIADNDEKCEKEKKSKIGVYNKKFDPIRYYRTHRYNVTHDTLPEIWTSRIS